MSNRAAGRDLRGELEDFDGEYPESWIPRVGDILVGTVRRYDSGTTDYGTYPIAVIEDEKGAERGVWLLHTVLREEFKEKRPKPGERVGVKRLPDSEKGYKRYALRVDRDEPEVPDFDGFADPGDVPPGDREELLEGESPPESSLGFQGREEPEEEADFSAAALEGEDDLPF